MESQNHGGTTTAPKTTTAKKFLPGYCIYLDLLASLFFEISRAWDTFRKTAPPPPPMASKVCTGQYAHIYWMIPIPDHHGPSNKAWMPKYMRGDV